MTARVRRMARFPLAPLEELLGPIWRPRGGNPGLHGREPLARKAVTERIAELAGVSPRTVTRWRRNGIDELHADRVAIGAGLHPSLVWGNAWWSSAGGARPRLNTVLEPASWADEVEQLERDVDELEAAIRAELERPL